MFMCVFNSDFQLLGKVHTNNLIILIRHHDQNFAVCLLEEKDMLLKNNSSECSRKTRELSQTSIVASLAFYNDRMAMKSKVISGFQSRTRVKSQNGSLLGYIIKIPDQFLYPVLILIPY